MKKLWILLLCLCLLLSACGKKTPTDPTGDTEPTEMEEELVASPEDPQEETEEEENSFGLSYLSQYGLNPFTCTATVNRSLFSLMYESLFVVTQDFNASPVLCDSFESVAGGTLYRFKLLEEARFSDGSPLTSEDVKASLRAAGKSNLYRRQKWLRKNSREVSRMSTSAPSVTSTTARPR